MSDTTIQKVINYIEKAIQEHPIKEEGKTYERKVYYMNGNDSTDFDWEANDRTCEFMVFYKTEHQLGYVSVFVSKSGYIRGWVWDTERYGKGIELEKEYIGESKANGLRLELSRWFDKLNRWDCEVCSL